MSLFAEATKKAASARFKQPQLDAEGQEIEVSCLSCADSFSFVIHFTLTFHKIFIKFSSVCRVVQSPISFILPSHFIKFSSGGHP